MGSGSIKLIVKNNDIKIENNEAIITIERSSPEYVTHDMASYALAYRVSKTIKTIIFEDSQKVIIKNKKSDMIVPENCQAWFDGCNNCFRGKGNSTMCTKKQCLVYQHRVFCTKWDK